MVRNRVEVMHGVNFDVLARRDPEQYGSLGLVELELKIQSFAEHLGLETTFFQTNHEGEFCERLHTAAELADGLLVNPGAWTHYSYAIRDALEVAGLPAVEMHLSNVDEREEWRRTSVIRELCIGRVHGKGVEGYREGLELLHAELSS